MSKDSKNKVLPPDLQEAVEKVFLAGLGALSVAEQEGKKYFTKLVKKGQRYDGPGREQVEQLRQQIEEQVERVRKDVDAQAGRAKQVVDAQAARVRRTVDDTVEGLEARVAEIVTSALHGLGIPTREEIDALRSSVQQLARNLDALRHEREIRREAAPAIEAVAIGGGWYEVRVRGVVVEKVQGEGAAAERVAALQREEAALPASARDGGVEAEPVGGGWYEVKVNGLVVEKVQGKAAAEAAVARLGA